ncbi:hypothetical protein LDENG_00246170 [Lucifuga dentata]|nr:hypothetical protein LDENG_00246170 [Lucifuga dentata]
MENADINYASVVFKNAKNPAPEGKKQEEAVYAQVKTRRETNEKTANKHGKKQEETVYDEVKTRSETNEQPANKHAGFSPDGKAANKGHQCRHLACCLGILCVILLSAISAIAVYLTTVFHDSDAELLSDLKQYKHNQTALLELNQNLTKIISNLSSANENMRREQTNMTIQITNLRRNNAVLKSQNTKVSAENKWLKINIKTLNTQIDDMTRQKNERNITLAQWSIDAYCPKSKERKCKACQDGWNEVRYNSSCYAVIDTSDVSLWRSWEEAQEDCRNKGSDLAVIGSQQELVRRILWVY